MVGKRRTRKLLFPPNGYMVTKASEVKNRQIQVQVYRRITPAIRSCCVQT